VTAETTVDRKMHPPQRHLVRPTASHMIAAIQLLDEVVDVVIIAIGMINGKHFR